MSGCACKPGEVCAEPITIGDVVNLVEVLPPLEDTPKKGRGRPKEVDLYSYPEMHTILRWVSRGPTDTIEGSESLASVEAYINSYLRSGWRLFATHYLGENPAGYGFVWFLVKE